MRDWRGWGLVVISVVAGFLYANFFLDVILPGEHDWTAVVSEMEMPGNPHADLLRATDVVCGVLILVLLPFVRAALPAGRRRGWAIWSTAAFAIGNAVAGVVPLPVADGGWHDVQQLVHDGASTVSQAAMFIGAVAIALDVRDRGPRWLHTAAWATFWIGGVVGTLLFGGFAYESTTSWQTGMAQRFQIVVSGLWVVCLGVYAATDGLRAWDAERASRQPAVAEPGR